MRVSRSILRKIRNVSHKVVEKIKAHILCSVTSPTPENHAVYEIVCKNIVQPDRPQLTQIAYAHCLLDNYGCRHTPSEYIILYFFLFHGNSGYAKAPQWYVIRILLLSLLV
jgi:hypothetical protein